MPTTFTLNGKPVTSDAPGNAMLLWVLRERLGMTGTRFGCGVGECGACTVHLDGDPVHACRLRLSRVAGREITTIEGLSKDRSHALQQAWIEEEVPQCGYCQSGQLMQAASLLAANPSPTREEIVSHMDGVLCRCGTYGRIIRAIERASAVNTAPAGRTR
ncbi:MAG: (2Fe-2S)-binding protein [Gemmatimonadota bacterium]|nr:(2Fe-2S)-binding protein [Gemmatimonadota bacterium]